MYDFLQKSGDIYASAEIYYSFGAIFSGILIIRLFRNFKILTSEFKFKLKNNNGYCPNIS